MAKQIRNLFDDNRRDRIEFEVEADEVLEMLKNVKAALKNSKNRKALGPDKIPVER